MFFELLKRFLTVRLWCGFVLLLAVLLAVKAERGISVETNILALLPATEQDPVVERASNQFNQALARRHILLVGATSLDDAIAAADTLYARIRKLPGINAIEYRFSAERQRAMLSAYAPFQAQLLDPATRALLQSGGGEQYLQQTLALMYSPMSPVSSKLLQQDPLLLFYRYASGLTGGLESVSLKQGVLSASFQGRHYVLLNLTLSGSPFSLELQRTLLPPLDAAILDLQKAMPAVEILNVGVSRFARAGVESAQREISTIGLGSLAGIIVLFLVVFRSPVPLLCSLLPIATGFIAALTACQWVFGTVHLLTLVFGASLIGISIDYSFHYFCDRLNAGPKWSGKAGIDNIFNGITLGLVTSVLGFAGLCFAPFPGMQQMALFSTVGLIAAYTTVVCLFPLLSAAPPAAAGKSVDWVKVAGVFAHRLHWQRRSVVVLTVALGVVATAGVLQLTSNDDIRLLQSTPEALRLEEQRASAVLGAGLSNQFLLIEGATAEQVLQREEAVVPTLEALRETGKLGRFHALSQFVPSVRTQEENIELVGQQIIAKADALARYGDALGLSPPLLDEVAARYQAAPFTPLLLSDWLESVAGNPWRHLWLDRTERGYASVIALFAGDTLSLELLEHGVEGVTLVDKVSDISGLLQQYRHRAAVLVACSYVLIFLLLCPRYGVQRAAKILAPPVLAVLLVLGVLGWTGQALNIFHLMALLLVLGIGVDYTLFLEEAHTHRQSTLLAIVLSAMTTLLSFGLLAVSSTAAVAAFGFSVLVGVLVCVILAPMLCGR